LTLEAQFEKNIYDIFWDMFNMHLNIIVLNKLILFERHIKKYFKNILLETNDLRGEMWLLITWLDPFQLNENNNHHLYFFVGLLVRLLCFKRHYNFVV
jgi:hypothetical protein